ncbi:hypothetical protein CDL15_Pgr009339 [Punica granatum]|uniref:Uncharacterized protein n=1 Tax=Punica granatum TaxID=22663 RepID=A0A218XIC4_PUNGR|nr:hypothetical protein CDL15_Pgr009339 [Punica granatum]
MEKLSYQKRLQYLRELANGDSTAHKLINAIQSRGKRELCQAAEQIILALDLTIRPPLDDGNAIRFHVKKMLEHLARIALLLSDSDKDPTSTMFLRIKPLQELLESIANSLGLKTEVVAKHDKECNGTKRYLMPNLKPHQILTEYQRDAVRFNVEHYLPKEVQRDIRNRHPSSFLRWRCRYIELQRNQRPSGTTEHNIYILREGNENYYWILKSTPRELAAELFEAGLVRVMDIEAGEKLKEFPSVIYKSLERERSLSPHKDLMLLVHSTPPEWNEAIVRPSYHLIRVTEQIGIPNPPGSRELSPKEITEEFIANRKAQCLENMFQMLRNDPSWTSVSGTLRILIQKKLKRKEKKQEKELREEFEKGIIEATHDMSDLARERLLSEMQVYKPKAPAVDAGLNREKVEQFLGENLDGKDGMEREENHAVDV